MVKSSVFASLHDNQVFDSIIKSIPVDVVNALTGVKWSAKDFLSNKDMLKSRVISAMAENTPIGKSVIDFIDSVFSSGKISDAFARTKFPISASFVGESNPAIGANTDKKSTASQGESPIGETSNNIAQIKAANKQGQDRQGAQPAGEVAPGKVAQNDKQPVS